MLLRQTIVMSALLTLVACAQLTTTPAPRQVATEPPVPEPVGPIGPVQVGLLLPLSGNAAAIGQDMLDAAQVAIFDVGASDMVLLPRDTKGTRGGALAAAQSALDAGAELIIGPLFGPSTAAIAPLARQHGIKVLSFSNDASVAGDGVYVLGYRPEEQVERVVEFAKSQGLQRVDAVAPDNPYGERAIAAWRASIEPPLTVQDRPASAFYPSDETAITGVIRLITDYDERQAALEEEKEQLSERDDDAAKAALEQLEQLDTLGDPPFDAMLIADRGSRLRSVAALLSFFDVDPAQTRLLGTMSWQDDPEVLLESTLQNSWIASVNPVDRTSFSTRFEDLFARNPSALAGLAYDATTLAADVAKRDRSFADNTLTDPGGFIGQSGIFRLQPDGVTEHGLAVLELRSGTFVMVDPAPSSFLATASF